MWLMQVLLNKEKEKKTQMTIKIRAAVHVQLTLKRLNACC